MKNFNLIIKANLIAFICLVFSFQSIASRWQVDVNNGIVWKPGKNDIPHNDHIEMSGEQMAFVLRWGIDKQGAYYQSRSLVFPMLRTVPNNTHASLSHRVDADIVKLLTVNGISLHNELVNKVSINGALEVISEWSLPETSVKTLRIQRTAFPSMTLPVMCERYVIENISNETINIQIPKYLNKEKTEASKGVDNTSYIINSQIIGDGSRVLRKNEKIEFSVIIQAYRESESPLFVDAKKEYANRMNFVTEVADHKLVLKTPNIAIDKLFRFSKIRASESIFKTKGGYMHAPGGEAYYAAIWANDQAEYVNPFFPFLGYEIGNESAINSFRHFARFMNPEYEKLPSSIISEGIDTWGGAGDRGDAAMIAYGAARYALTKASKSEAQELWPLIEWCLEYSHRKITKDGVVASDADELENRFPAGDANLCTSTLYYDALQSAVYLGKELKVSPKQISNYTKRLKQLEKSIDNHFGSNIEGFSTYRYYDGNDILRSWICMPLIVNIMDRKDETVNALFSPKLMTEDGLLTAQGSTTFWDRSTLYALRGIYNAGYSDRATEFLDHYSKRRLLGDHVPYPIEAWPEGSQRHLSAESGLYCRIITEGLFGLRPTGFKTFDITPSMPKDWNEISLRNINAFDTQFDIEIERMDNDKLSIRIKEIGKKEQKISIRSGKTVNLKL